MFVIFFEQRGRWKFIGVVVAIKRGKSKAGLGLDNWNDDFCNLEVKLVLGVEECLSKMVEILNGVPRAVGTWEDFVGISWGFFAAGNLCLFASASLRISGVAWQLSGN